MYCQITPSYKNMPWFKLYRNIFKNKSLIKTAKSGITYFILLPVKDKPENIHRAITGVKFSICGIILAKAVTKITRLIKNVFSILFIIINGARGRSRTGTVLLPRDFKSLASTNSATRAVSVKTILFIRSVSQWSFLLYSSMHKAKVGIEPALTALQAAALPLCHLARKWAGNEARTRDLNLGKVALYQLSYSRKII